MEWLSKLRIFLVSVTAIILICIAVAFSILRAVLPHATGYTAEIEKEISKQIGLPITIGSLDADMNWLVPRLRLIDLSIYRSDGEKELVHFDEALFALSYFESIRNLTLSVGKISLVGADITVEKMPENKWLVQGMEIKRDSDTTGSERLARLLLNTNIALLDSNIYWRDHTDGIGDMNFEGVNIATEYLLGEHSLEIEMLLPESLGQTLRFIIVLSGDLNKIEESSSRVYVDVTSLNLENILSKAGPESGFNATGVTDAQLWFTLNGKNIVQLAGNVSANSLVLSNSKTDSQQWKANELTGEFAWRRQGEGWRLDIKGLLVDRGSELWAQPSNMIIDNLSGTGVHMAASYFRATDLYYLPDIFLNKEQISELASMYSMLPYADIYNLDLSVPVNEGKPDYENAQISSAFSNVNINYPEKDIFVDGLDGEILIKDSKARISFVSNNIGFVFKEMFREPIWVDVFDGVVDVSLGEDSISVSSESIHLSNSDIDTVTRVSAIIEESGKNLLDLQTSYSDGTIADARKYYPVSMMSKELVSWLDSAFTEGRISSGGFIFYGNVDEFPFPDNQGVMQALFRLENTQLNFSEEWPEIIDLGATVQFRNASLSVEQASGKTYGSRIRDVNVSIPDLRTPYLTVSGLVDSSSGNVQQYIWNSGLNDILGNAMNQFKASGDVTAKLTFSMPLADSGGAVKTEGNIAFSDNKFFFPETDYTLSALSGKLSFTDQSVSANSISAMLGNDPIKIGVSTITGQGIDKIVFSIKGDIDIDALVKKFVSVPEDWMSGASQWNIDVSTPYGDSDYDLQVNMNSDLKGVTLNMSDRLSKSAQKSLPLNIVIAKRLEKLYVDIEADGVFNLSSYNVDHKWWVNLDSDLIKGVSEFPENITGDSTIVLNLDYLDLPPFYRSEKKDSDNYNIEPTDFPALSVQIKRLKWDEVIFNNAVLRTSWNTHGMLIDDIEVVSNSLRISGSGSWLKSWNSLHQSSFNLTVSSDNVGDALVNLGFSRVIENGTNHSTINWSWPAEPYRFDIEKIEGTANIELKKGEIRNVKPGAGGRLLGLLNVLQLPKRLMLDFGDVTSKGLVFDTIVGDFKYSDGIAATDNTYISAAAADIKMTGSVGLVDQDYDLQVQVQPHDTAATFAGGTIYGGPVVGAGLVLLQKLFGIETISRDEYTITGSWDDPVVTQTAKRKRGEQREKADE